MPANISILLFFLLAGLSFSCSETTSGGPCQTTQDCVSGEICISGHCQPLTTTKGCKEDDDCQLGEWCDISDGICKVTNSDTDAGTTHPDATSQPDASPPIDSGVNPDATTPHDTGTNSCFQDNECGTPPINICVSNQCVLGCGQPGGLTCTGGTTCNNTTGHCDAQSTCNIDSDCNPPPPTQICENNSCVFGCGVDPNLCVGTQICNTQTGRCVAGPTNCSGDSECNPPTTVCESTQCVPGCAEPGGVQCAAPTPTCDPTTGRCTNRPPCQNDPDCNDATLICESQACVLRCDQPGAAACVSPATCNTTSGRCEAPPVCQLDAECNDPNLICVSSQCVTRCDAPTGGCTGSDVCNTDDGRCLPGQLQLGGTCSIDAQCISTLCLPLTIGTNSYTICSEPCGASSNCPLDFTCADLSGMGFCLGETLFGPPPATFDTVAGGACSDTVNTCQSGWCNTGTNQCIETCSRNFDCTAFGGNCWNYEQTGTSGTTYDHICYSPTSGATEGTTCATNTDCRSGICNRYDTVCAAHCCSQSDCSSNQNCSIYDLDTATVVKICADRGTSAGTTQLGSTCTDAADCASGICVPTDPSDALSPRKCSTTCCRNTDCQILPAGGNCRAASGPVTDTIVGLCFPN